jgi:hypothetical protein
MKKQHRELEPLRTVAIMNFWRRRRFASCLAFAGLVASGCGGEADTRPRQAVTGEVLLDGQPMVAGQVMFDPRSRSDGVGTQAKISDGKFSIGSSEGPTPGSYGVRIYAGITASPETVTRKKLGDTKREIDTPQIKEPISKRFNTDTTLTAEVKAGGPNSFKFEIDSKPDPASKTTARRKTH